MKTIPVCYFPTTVIMVDDQQSFLEAMEHQLDDTIARYEFYRSPAAALKYLGSVSQENPLTKRCVFKNEEENADHRALDLSIPSIYKEIYNKEKSKQISTLIVDYNMPAMNGLDFCSHVNIPYIQKILLTGTATDSVAVQAFNTETIQGYLQKQDHEVFEKLHASIIGAQKRYFVSLSQLILESVCLHSADLHALKDPAFITYFEKFCEENTVQEYYLLDDQGSFLAVKAGGERCGIYVYSEKKMQGLVQLATESEGISANVIDKIKQGFILCYHNRDENSFPEEDQWQNCLYPSTIVKGSYQTYYCAIVPDIFDIDEEAMK